MEAPVVLLFKSRGWWGPTHGGTHVKRAPHKEIEAIGSGYDQVLQQHQGHRYDPLIAIQPKDMESVAISRGGWKGLGDLEVKGSGYGLVKFIWRHGEKSVKPERLRVTKDDVMAFPKVIREFKPSRDATDESPGREWRVVRHHPVFGERTIVYADSLIDGNRHLVSIYVQDDKRAGTDIPLSLRKSNADTLTECLGKLFEAHAEGSVHGFLRHSSQRVSATQTIPRKSPEAKQRYFVLINR